MPRRRLPSIVVWLLGMMLGYASHAVALDAETQQLEKEVVCQAMPWSCGKIERAPALPEAYRAPAPRQVPVPKKPPEKSTAQLEKEVKCETMPWNCGKNMPPLQTATPRSCAEVKRDFCIAASGYPGTGPVTWEHLLRADDCVRRLYDKPCP